MLSTTLNKARTTNLTQKTIILSSTTDNKQSGNEPVKLSDNSSSQNRHTFSKEKSELKPIIINGNSDDSRENDDEFTSLNKERGDLVYVVSRNGKEHSYNSCAFPTKDED